MSTAGVVRQGLVEGLVEMALVEMALGRDGSCP